MFLLMALGRCSTGGNHGKEAAFPLGRGRRDRAALCRGHGRLGAYRDGPPALDRSGPAEDRGRELPRRVQRPDHRQPSPSSCCSTPAAVADVTLMRRYARVDPPGGDDSKLEAEPA